MTNILMKPQMMLAVHMVVSPISELDAICSPEVYIHGVPWQIQASKNEEENSLAVHLKCAKKDESFNWAVPACSTIKLLPFSDEKDVLEECTTPYVFRSTSLAFGFSDFIQWDELMDEENKYVQNDTIELKIEITADDPNYVDRSILKFGSIDKSCDCGSTATFRLMVKNAKNLLAVRSPQFIVRGLPWCLSVYKLQTSTLGIILNTIESPNKVSCKMTMSVKLLSSKDDVVPIEKSNTDSVEWPDNLDIDEIISWDELLKPESGFVNNDSMTLEVNIEAAEPKGDVPNVDSNNVAKRGRFECSICLEGLENQDMSTTPCGHLFCTECITKAVRKSRVCPLCKEAVQLKKLHRMYLSAAK